MTEKISLRRNNEDSSEESDSDDDYTENEKLLLKNARKKPAKYSDSEEEVYAIQSDLESDDSDNEKISDSDINDNEDDLPDERAWGKNKRVYYSTDYVDPDYGGFDANDVDAAEMEEEEAKTIQNRLLEQLDEDDFSLDVFKPPESRKKTETTQEIIKTDLSSMSKRQKLDLLQKESPEFLGLINEFKEKLYMIVNYLGPVLDKIKQKELPEDHFAKFVKVYHNICFNYILHINFYMLLKSVKADIKYHPVVKRIIEFRELYCKLEPIYSENIEIKIKKLLETLSESLNNEKQNQTLKKHKTLNILKKDMDKGRKRKNTNAEIDENENKKLESKKNKTDVKSTEILSKTKSILKKESKSSKKKVEFNEKDSIRELNNEDDSVQELNKETDEVEETGERRAITYQMAKNKGLTPHRKKEQRNPRVKHRNKYKKAKVRRKGAVREVRKELSRYSGEISGIKASVTKSIKIK